MHVHAQNTDDPKEVEKVSVPYDIEQQPWIIPPYPSPPVDDPSFPSLYLSQGKRVQRHIHWNLLNC